MSKTTFGFVTAAAILASVTAFAQDPAPAAPAAAPSDSAAAPSGKAMHKHHHMMKGAKSANNAGTDHDADKLNACMSNATPTDAQAQCLKQASS